MRIDQFLWCIRYYKSRTLATEACKKGNVKLNNKIIKPSKEINIGEIIEIKKKQIIYKIEISDIPDRRVSPKINNLYFINLTDISNLNKLKNQSLYKNNKRDDGKGRPTKKERREIDKFIN